MDVTKPQTDKRQATRKALLVAARDLVFEKGHDRISIQEITARAKVATGTYYNYFETKQDVFTAVVENLRTEIADNLAETRESIRDPAQRVATTLRYYFHQSAHNQDWHEFINCVGLSDLSLQQDDVEALADIEKGIKAGRFRVEDIHFTQSLISGMVRHVNEKIQRSEQGLNSIDYAVRSILQMLGLPDLVTKALTQSPLPPVAAPKRLRRTESTGVSNKVSTNESIVTPLAQHHRYNEVTEVR